MTQFHFNLITWIVADVEINETTERVSIKFGRLGFANGAVID